MVHTKKTTHDRNMEMLALSKDDGESNFVADMAHPIISQAVMTRAHATVKLSFHPQLWPMRRVTQAEYKRRFEMCIQGYRQMRDELRTSRRRALDAMEFYVQENLEREQAAAAAVQPIITRATWRASN